MQRPDDATEVHLNGYDKAVQRYLEHPRGALVRKFLSLQIKNILYYQAELNHLEKDLNDCIRADAQSRAPANASLPQHTIDLQTSWWHLYITENSEQWELLKKIRSTLTEYQTALVRLSQIEKLGRPHRLDMRLARDYFCDKENGPNIESNEISFWTDETLPDSEFVALFTNDDERNKDLDKLTLWIIQKLEWCHYNILERYRKATCAGRGGGKPTFKYDVRRIADTVSLATLISAPLINFAAMLALYSIKDMKARLAIILVFTQIFSIIMSALTNNRTATMFAATTAYSAVLVVFVGNPNAN
ncbi:hypothetical protein VTN00DRAFT_5136 [Thermoascus crustaceus]|uniref:uncharacterized protein n=1 Tax=Thermoascus crustaceus TaxID=5088 RepID=UPI003742F44C